MRAEVDRGRCDKDCKKPHDASVSLRTFPDYHSPMYVRGERVAIPACPAACSSGLCVQRYLPHMSGGLAMLAAMRRASSRVSWGPASDCLHTAKKC